jgi:hypothetical protein
VLPVLQYNQVTGSSRNQKGRTVEAAIEVADVRKRFGQAGALDGMSVTVRLGGFVGNPTWQRRIQRYSPMAGITIQATTGPKSLAIAPWAGLGALAIWAAAALVGGGLMLRLRDA